MPHLFPPPHRRLVARRVSTHGPARISQTTSPEHTGRPQTQCLVLPYTHGRSRPAPIARQPRRNAPALAKSRDRNAVPCPGVPPSPAACRGCEEHLLHWRASNSTAHSVALRTAGRAAVRFWTQFPLVLPTSDRQSDPLPARTDPPVR